VYVIKPGQMDERVYFNIA